MRHRDVSSRRRNPYRSAKGGPRQRLSVAAFVDILGYTEMVRETVSAGESPLFLRRLKAALDRALKPIHPAPDRFLDKDLYAVKVFTDSSLGIQYSTMQSRSLGTSLNSWHCFSWKWLPPDSSCAVASPSVNSTWMRTSSFGQRLLMHTSLSTLRRETLGSC